MGFGLAFASGVQLLKICYYEMPKNKEKLENINRENHINNVDERKVFLRITIIQLWLHIRHLREKLGEVMGHKELIKTVWGVGYKVEE